MPVDTERSFVTKFNVRSGALWSGIVATGGGAWGVRTGPVGADMETGGIQMSGLATGDIWAQTGQQRAQAMCGCGASLWPACSCLTCLHLPKRVPIDIKD